MPFQPPTRPHSARPQAIIDPTVFSTATGSRPRPPRSTSHMIGTHGRKPQETEWDDAWDSSSDKDEGEETGLSSYRHPSPSSSKRGVPIPARPETEARGSAESVQYRGVAASWTSGSFQHVTLSGSSDHPPHSRPTLPTSKTYADATTAPPPGTFLPSSSQSKHAHPATNGESSWSKLPPGGSWEIVEEAELRDEPVEVIKAGKEALRVDIDDILTSGLLNALTTYH